MNRLRRSFAIVAIVMAVNISGQPPVSWMHYDAQHWNCYSTDFTVLEYDFLGGLRCKVRGVQNHYAGRYLFTVAPVGDGYSDAPDQAKEFAFVQLDNGRLTKSGSRMRSTTA